jgi:hypothetical protein
MNKLLAVVFVLLVTCSVACAQTSKNKKVKKVSTLGVSPKGAPSCGTVAYWTNPMIISAYADKSITGEKLIAFLNDEKKVQKYSNAFGSQFCILAIEQTGITKIIVKDKKITEMLLLLPNDETMFWPDGMKFIKN